MKKQAKKIHESIRSVVRGRDESARKRNKVIFGAAALVLMAALGLEVTNNDLDVQKVLQGESLEESRVDRPWTLSECTENAYNCADFASQGAAQNMFEQCGGLGSDVNRLDGDGDGIACEALGY